MKARSVLRSRRGIDNNVAKWTRIEAIICHYNVHFSNTIFNCKDERVIDADLSHLVAISYHRLNLVLWKEQPPLLQMGIRCIPLVEVIQFVCFQAPLPFLP